MKPEQRLMVELGDGSRADEYRIRNREVEFRARCREGPTSDAASEWRQLTAEDISLHLALHTVVGEWLTTRLLHAETDSGHSKCSQQSPKAD